MYPVEITSPHTSARHHQNHPPDSPLIITNLERAGTNDDHDPSPAQTDTLLTPEIIHRPLPTSLAIKNTNKMEAKLNITNKLLLSTRIGIKV